MGLLLVVSRTEPPTHHRQRREEISSEIMGRTFLGEDEMARFQLTQAIALPQVRFRAGDVVTDLQPATVAGDRYWAGLSATTMGPGMVPLDSGATTMKVASAFNGEVIRTWITGADSIG
jgi:hypothetical protein